MSDNLTSPIAAGTAIASKDIGGVQYPRNILVGGDGAELSLATQATLAAVLAKLIGTPATEAKQDTQITILTALAQYLDGVEGLLSGAATQTTLAALLAKTIAAPATEAKQDALNTAIATLLTYSDGLETLITATNTLLAAATPAGAAIIGKVGIDQTAGQNIVTVPALALSATSVSTTVAALAASTALLVANPLRKGGAIVNDSTSILYIKLSAGASATSYDYFLAGSSSGVPAQFEIPQGYTGPINGFWVSAVGNARVSERTA